MTIINDLSAVPPLGRGGHDDISYGACIMEAISHVAGEPWSDHPQCVCRVLGAFLRSWNDALPDDERDTLLRPLVLLLPGTRSTPAVIRRRSVMAADWLIRVHTPTWLRLAGLQAQADALANLPEVTDTPHFQPMMSTVQAVRDAADAAWDATRDVTTVEAVAGDVVRAAVAASVVAVAVGDAAIAAIRASGGVSVGVKAVSVVAGAVGDTAAAVASVVAAAAGRKVAAMAVLNPTRLELQQSALALVHRMIAVTEVTL